MVTDNNVIVLFLLPSSSPLLSSPSFLLCDTSSVLTVAV